ncbi:TEL2-interacting protein 1 [Podochytrium sp. JEL0797]|nr:TEL2-interacting protein 1 [Podochytrium sp. JEL0797]
MRLNPEFDDETRIQKIANCPRSTYLHGAYPWDIFFTYPHIRNFWLPNIEQMDRKQAWILPQTHTVLCKTHISCTSLAAYMRHYNLSRPILKFMSHSTPDASLPDSTTTPINDNTSTPTIEQQDFNAFLHVYGHSPLKHTREIIQCFEWHPEWPTLTILGNQDATSLLPSTDPDAPPRTSPFPPPNIHILPRVPIATLRHLQRTHGIHLCPSKNEGYGHYLNEARSLSALVVTTNHAPMNEFVLDNESGILVDHLTPREESYRMIEPFFHPTVDVMPFHVCEGVKRVMGMSVEARREMGQRAREGYERDTREMERNMEVVEREAAVLLYAPVRLLFAVLSDDKMTQVDRDAAVAMLGPALSRGEVSFAVADDLLVAVPLLLSYGRIPSSLSTPRAAPSAEFCASALRALSAGLKAVSEPDRSLRAFALPKCGAALAASLDALPKHKDKALHAACLDAIGAILALLDEPNTARVLPGLVASLVVFVETANSDKLNSSTLVSTLQVLKSVLVKVLAEGKWLDKVRDEIAAPTPPTSPLAATDSTDIRNYSWYTNTCLRLAEVSAKLLTPLRKTQRHQNFKVRLAYLHFSSSLISNCYETLSIDSAASPSNETTIKCLLQCMAGFMEDETQQVRDACVDAFRQLLEKHPRNDEIIAFATKSAFDLISDETPRALESIDWDRKVDLLQLCAGYLGCLGTNPHASLGLRDLTFTSGAVQVFLDAVLTSVVFENSNVKLIEDREIGKAMISLDMEDTAVDAGGGVSNSVTKYLDSNQPQSVLTRISRVFQLLARYGNAELIFNRLVSFFEDATNSPANQSVAIFLLNEFCSGFSTTDTHPPSESHNPLLHSLIMVYLSSPILPAATTPTPSNSSSTRALLHPIKTINTHIINTCLLLDGLRTAALALSTSFSPFLLHALYPVIEKTGAANRFVSQTAAHTLHAFAHACSGGSVRNLVLENMDYVVNELSLRVRYLNEYPDAPGVLVAVVGVAGGEVVPLLMGGCLEDLLAAVDMYQGQGMVVGKVFVALERIVVVLKGMEGDEVRFDGEGLRLGGGVEEGGGGVSKEVREFEALFRERKERWREVDEEVAKESNLSPREFFDSFLAKEKTPDSSTDPEQQQADETKTQDKDTAPPLTPAQETAHKILLKTHHFLTRSDPHLQSLTLRLAAHCVALLSHNVPRTLNPTLHALWPTVLRLLTSPHHFVVLDALDLVSAFARASRDFVAKRFVTDLMPRFETVFSGVVGRDALMNHDRRGGGAGRGTMAKRSPATTSTLQDPHEIIFKIVSSALDTLATMVSCVATMQVQDLSRVTECVWPFLGGWQHVKVQALARRVVVLVGGKDANEVWIRVWVVKMLREGSTSGGDVPRFWKEKMEGWGGVDGFYESVEFIERALMF